EIHLVAVHMICAAFDAALERGVRGTRAAGSAASTGRAAGTGRAGRAAQRKRR
ncbi:phosphoheptose isomerase, partial [Streptomyces sp. SID5926]|nr:phosphoheptose isomerase [Streptomyces sp. SID5926]